MRIFGINKIILLGIFCLISALLPFSHSYAANGLNANPGKAVPNFEPSSCMFELPSGAVEGEDVTCGYLIVPEDHSAPLGPTIKLAVAIIKSKDPLPKPDPLVMAQGGPGGSTIETYAQTLITNRSDFSPDRDIILFDQRGTKYSRPNLYCAEFDKLISDTVEEDLTDEQERSYSISALEECRKRLSQEEGLNLSAYDSIENAADIEDLRKALGYDKINFYGVSYGTLLGLHFMRAFPDSLRSVVLDAVVPPQTNFILNSAQTEDASFTNLFAACKESPECNQAFPELEQVFFKVVDELNSRPARIELTDPETAKKYSQAVIDGDVFLSATFQMLYAGSLIPALPRMISDAKDGDFRFFSKIYSLFLFDRSMSLGMYYSVICSEDADFQPEEYKLNGIRPQIAEAEEFEAVDLLKICENWNVERLDSGVDQPVRSSVPTLLLSGKFDPITPPAYAQQVASKLDNSFSVVFPSGGHGQALEGDCSNSVINAFLDNPENSPDTSCIDKSVGFFTPQNTIDFPIGLDLLNFEEKIRPVFFLLFSSWICVASAVPVIPLIWLLSGLRRKRRQGSETILAASFPSGENASELVDTQTEKPSPRCRKYSGLAGWLAAAAGFLISLFMIGLIVVLLGLAFENDNRLFFGISAASAPLFFLPWIVLLLWIGMIGLSMRSWICRQWSVWTRIYFSLLTLGLSIFVLAMHLIGSFMPAIQRLLL